MTARGMSNKHTPAGQAAPSSREGNSVNAHATRSSPLERGGREAAGWVRPSADQLPEPLLEFLGEPCRFDIGALHFLPAAGLPARDRGLLAHQRDMTSTLATFHDSALRVQILRRETRGDLYLREVFLRTADADRIVEYGVIGIALEQFSAPQRAAIEAGETPLGALLHQFKISFISAPIGFFAVGMESRIRTPLATLSPGTCFGRFNRLTKPTGEPLAWIMEILPPA